MESFNTVFLSNHSGIQTMTNYSFMRTGMQPDVQMNTNRCLDRADEARMAMAIVLTYAEDAKRMALMYRYRSPTSVTGPVNADAMVKCLKARAMCGVGVQHNPIFASRVASTMARISDGSVDITAAGVVATDDIEQCRRLVVHVNAMCGRYDSWQPADLVHQSLKAGIDRASTRLT
jgi:hypothetical protein